MLKENSTMKKGDILMWKTAVMDFYYGESNKSLEEIAQQEGVDFAVCQQYFQSLSIISTEFRKLPEEELSPWLAGKVLARAREIKNTETSGILSWFKPMWRPLLAGAVPVLLVAFLGVRALMPSAVDVSITNVATLALPKTVKDDSANQRFFMPLRPYFRTFSGPASAPGLSVTKVSLSPSFQDPLKDPELDQKILTRSSLTATEVESLFFRARKLQQLGHYREAIRDFEFIAKFYPGFHQVQVLPVTLASCYEALHENDSAISILQKFEKTHGDSPEIDLWIDELKSETF